MQKYVDTTKARKKLKIDIIASLVFIIFFGAIFIGYLIYTSSKGIKLFDSYYLYFSLSFIAVIVISLFSILYSFIKLNNLKKKDGKTISKEDYKKGFNYVCGKCGNRFGFVNNDPNQVPDECPYCGVKLDWKNRESSGKTFARRLLGQGYAETIPPLLEEDKENESK